MRAVLQRVSRASVTVDGAITGQIGAGLLILICAMEGDTEAQADQRARRPLGLRETEPVERDVGAVLTAFERDLG